MYIIMRKNTNVKASPAHGAPSNDGYIRMSKFNVIIIVIKSLVVDTSLYLYYIFIGSQSHIR